MYSKIACFFIFLSSVSLISSLFVSADKATDLHLKSTFTLFEIDEFLCSANYQKISEFEKSIGDKKVRFLIDNFCPAEISSNYKKFDDCSLCRMYYDSIRVDNLKYSQQLSEICKWHGCEFLLNRSVVYNEYSIKEQELEQIVKGHCQAASKDEQCRLCIETGNNECIPVSSSLDSQYVTESQRDFKRGDIRIVVSLNGNYTEDKNVFKKRIHTSPTEFYDTCSMSSCFRKPENANGSYCRFHSSGPLLTKEKAFYEVDLESEEMMAKLDHIETILKYEFDINSKKFDFYVFVFFEKPEWWKSDQIPYEYSSLYHSENFDRLITAAYYHHGEKDKLKNGVFW